jgi:hypothetical protein
MTDNTTSSITGAGRRADLQHRIGAFRDLSTSLARGDTKAEGA